MENLQIIRDWIRRIRKKSHFRYRFISFDESADWRFRGGSLRHNSDHFFRIIGVKWKPFRGKMVSQPLIDQREIGLLAFLMRKKKTGNEILVQAKLEPGNIGFVQLAPTCQATESNTRCFHGGKKPPFADYFQSTTNYLYDIRQSEQGTRFFGKRNRNILAWAPKKVRKTELHRWLKVSEMLDLLKKDFLINTDARSVLVCSPWDQLIGREPFARHKKGFGAELRKSYCETAGFLELRRIKSEIRKRRMVAENVRINSLEKIAGWIFGADSISKSDGKEFSVRQIQVRADGREVSEWDQPIVSSTGSGIIRLICGRRSGVLYFLFRAIEEPGLFNRVELMPSITVSLGDLPNKGDIFVRGIVRSRCRQSEEGGRFFRDVNDFQIVDVGHYLEKDEKNYYWLTLWQIRRLLDEAGWFTNEARSALSLILPWL